jgi:hypothetical protein
VTARALEPAQGPHGTGGPDDRSEGQRRPAIGRGPHRPTEVRHNRGARLRERAPNPSLDASDHLTAATNPARRGVTDRHRRASTSQTRRANLDRRYRDRPDDQTHSGHRWTVRTDDGCRRRTVGRRPGPGSPSRQLRANDPDSSCRSPPVRRPRGGRRNEVHEVHSHARHRPHRVRHRRMRRGCQSADASSPPSVYPPAWAVTAGRGAGPPPPGSTQHKTTLRAITSKGKALSEKMSGGVLLSHPVPRAVPSALKGLTSGFGMEPGVSPSPWPPKLYGDVRSAPSPDICPSQAPDRISGTAQWTRNNITRDLRGLPPCPEVSRSQAARPISTGQLHTSPCFHLRPINPVV